MIVLARQPDAEPKAARRLEIRGRAGGNALGLVPAHAVARELRDEVLAEIVMQPALPKLVMRAIYAQAPVSPMADELVTSLRGSLQ